MKSKLVFLAVKKNILLQWTFHAKEKVKMEFQLMVSYLDQLGGSAEILIQNENKRNEFIYV